ncbi:MAG: hypothetical protein CPSOU_1855 [uncultured Paraburkholderia sp.]|nr:MAG: hypothetical protein CPSOU_1855 [uncultured Paraburkholderia sp.]
MDSHIVAYFRHLFTYDPETGSLRWNHGKKRGKLVDSVTGKGYFSVQIGRRTRVAHRIAWAIHYGEMPLLQIDHVNGDKLDNRLENLRLANNIENNRSKRLNSRKSLTGYKGVYSRYGKFEAKIGVQGKSLNLGVFPTPDEAAHAYNKAAVREFGEFAVLNPIGYSKDETVFGSELIAHLRRNERLSMTIWQREDFRKAADLIEAQTARIAELELALSKDQTT